MIKLCDKDRYLRDPNSRLRTTRLKQNKAGEGGRGTELEIFHQNSNNVNNNNSDNISYLSNSLSIKGDITRFSRLE
jgi:hypothetical protein